MSLDNGVTKTSLDSAIFSFAGLVFSINSSDATKAGVYTIYIKGTS